MCGKKFSAVAYWNANRQVNREYQISNYTAAAVCDHHRRRLPQTTRRTTCGLTDGSAFTGSTAPVWMALTVMTLVFMAAAAAVLRRGGAGGHTARRSFARTRCRTPPETAMSAHVLFAHGRP